MSLVCLARQYIYVPTLCCYVFILLYVGMHHNLYPPANT